MSTPPAASTSAMGQCRDKGESIAGLGRRPLRSPCKFRASPVLRCCSESTQSGPDASAQSVGRVTRLSRNVRQPNHVLANQIGGHKAERRPGAGEEWLAATKHDGVEVKSILINETKVG
jgi:hypothetical protein